MNICIIGTGYVGLVTGACLSEVGHKVICVDNNERKIAMLKEGKIPIYEAGLEELVQSNKTQRRLKFTTSIKEGVGVSDVIFICVGTPPKQGGEADLTGVEKVTRKIARCAKSPKLIVEKSTVPVKTGKWIKRVFKMYNSQVEFDIASNPEFLREGTAISDFLNPDRIVVGVESKKAENTLRKIYEPIINHKFNFSLREPSSPYPVPVVVTDIQSAEIIKHASNSFLAMKISYINAIADICEKVGADVERVAEGMGLDRRVGRHFLKAGLGFGGFCFPKDLQAFIRIAKDLNYDFALLREVERINRERPKLLVKKIKDALWIIKDKTIGILGLSFKPGTDDMRFAPSLEVIDILQKEGARIKVYDPASMKKAKKLLPHIVFTRNPYDAIEGANALLILTEWNEFKTLNFFRIKKLMINPVIVDGRNMFDPLKMREAGFIYKCMGRG
ncbi:UDP-glucose/GDP-mannose dehydrogenase family protein [Patescibacteria group bacterium]|nr:UDP-glucose/GDP-mannose dehydrogenase family protein [Patescibacteria group bacterium]